MPEKTFQCRVITPDAQIYDGPAESVAIPAHDGGIGILRNRAPLLCKLGAGRMRIHSEQRDESWFVDGGFAQVLDNRVTVLTQKALRADEIDRVQAEALLTEARKLKPTDDVSARRKAQLEASARAQLRIARR